MPDFRTSNYGGNAKHIGNTGRQAMRGETVVYFAEANKGIDPLLTPGLFTWGRAKTIPDFKRAIDTEKIEAGYPKQHLYSIPIKDTMELPFTFDHIKLALMQALSGDVALGINKTTAGQTTILTGSTPTASSAVLTDSTGIAVGDMCLVGTKHATYGGWDETAIIKSVNTSTDAVTFEGLTNAPLADAIFHKLKGKTTGTTGANTGIHLFQSLVTTFVPYHVVCSVNVPGARAELVISIPEFEIIPESVFPNFNSNLAEVSFKGMARSQPEKLFTLIDGSTEMRPWNMEGWWIPYESAV